MIEAATAQLAVHVTVFRGGAASGHRAPAAATPQLQGLGALTEPAASMYEGAVVHLRDAKGLRHLARLLTHPDRPVLRLHPRPTRPPCLGTLTRAIDPGPERRCTRIERPSGSEDADAAG